MGIECKVCGGQHLTKDHKTSTGTGLLPCPFCGEKRINHMRGEVGHLHWLSCANCRMEGPIAIDWEEATELWNTRK